MTAYNFKKFTDLETVEKVPEGAKVVGIVDDKVVQLDGSGLGGGGGFVAVFTQDAETETWTCDKTFEECVEAFEKGNIAGIVKTSGGGSYGTFFETLESSLGVTRVIQSEETVGFMFGFTDAGTLQFNPDGSISN